MKNRLKIYNSLELEIVVFSQMDIIKTSFGEDNLGGIPQNWYNIKQEDNFNE